MAEVTLYSQASTGLTLPQAMASYRQALDGGVGLFYSPHQCALAHLDANGNARDAQGNAIALEYAASRIFEARVFTAEVELRWSNELDGSGQVVLLGERAERLPGSAPHARHCQDALAQRYLLWGEKASPQQTTGWQRLASARIGALDVPLSQSLAASKRVYLTATEYLAEVDGYGNVAVIEERLTGLEVA